MDSASFGAVLTLRAAALVVVTEPSALTFVVINGAEAPGPSPVAAGGPTSLAEPGSGSVPRRPGRVWLFTFNGAVASPFACFAVALAFSCLAVASDSGMTT